MPTAAACRLARLLIRLVAATALVSVAALTLGALFAAALDPSLGFATRDAGETLTLALLNGIPGAVLMLALYVLTRRALFAASATAALYAGLVVASTIKLEQLGLPLLPADFRFLSASGGAMLFWHYVEPLQLFAPAALLLLALLALCRKPVSWQPPLATRLVLGLCAGLAGVTLVGGANTWRNLYDGWNRGFEPWSPAETVARLGVSTTLLSYHWELVRPDRQPPDRDRILEFIAEHADAFSRAAERETSGELPDIVVVQSESFFDPARLNGLVPAQSLPHFRALARKGLTGDMGVPTYAGGTIRTEFEVLSGVPLAAFPGVEYPYFELVDAAMPGLMRTLADLGYSTSVLHPNDAGFWNRRDALARLGAERFLALPAFAGARKSGLFIADAELTDRLLTELRDDGPPQFLFAISMEGHGPYEVSPGLDPQQLAAIEVPASLDEYGARTLRHYLYHLANADRELGRLAAALQQRKRPSVLLFYGDHLPGLHSTFAQLGFRDGNSPRSQPVPYLVLDNRRAKARREDSVAWMLPALLLDTAAVPADAYFALVASLRQPPSPLQPQGTGSAPEARFVELARLRVRNEFDADALMAALEPPPAAVPAETARPAQAEEAATN